MRTHPISSLRPLRFLTTLLFAAFCSLGWAPPAAAVPETTYIPVVLNIYPGSGTTPEKAKEAIEEANKILKQADAKLVVVKTNNPPAGNGGDDGSGGGTAGDGTLTGSEFGKAQDFGGKEIEGLKGKKGIKISFVKTPYAPAPTSPGASVHRNPTVVVKDRGDKTKTGETIAHELGHVLTLGAGHTITGGSTADRGGHTPPGTGSTKNGNLMAPSNRRTGTALTPEQIEEIKKRLRKHGHCSKQFGANFPAVKCVQAFGRSAGSSGQLAASGLGIYDLTEVWLSATAENGHYSIIEGQITVADARGGTASFTLGFDADADAATGVVHGGVAGVDRFVEVTVTPSPDGDATPPTAVVGVSSTAISQLFGFKSAQVMLPMAAVVVEDEHFPDLDGVATEGSLSVLLSLPADSLGLTAQQVPVVVTSAQGASIRDQASFVYDQQAWQKRPTLATFGTGTPTPGSAYPFAISGLEPGSPFVLYLGGETVYNGTLDATGSFQGSIVFPSSWSIATHHTLVAQDATGEFAATITCPEWDTAPTPNPTNPGVIGTAPGTLRGR